MTANAKGSSSLVSIDLRVPGSGQSGRAFLPREFLHAIQIEKLEVELARTFVDEDDCARMELLATLVHRRRVVIETYPGEESPVELHAYVQALGPSGDPVFACVLAPYAVVEHLVASPPHVVLESASLQVIGDDVSPATIRAGLETWMRRVWPNATVPNITLREWPDIVVSRVLSARLVPAWPRLHLTSSPMRGAPERLQTEDYPTREEIGRP